MGSQSMAKIPVIDFSKPDLKPGTSAWCATRDEVRRALEDQGCFEISYSGIPSALLNSLFTIAEQLLDIPMEVKLQNQHITNIPHMGYYTHKYIPRYESLAVHDPTTIEGIRKFANLVWPQGNDHFCESTKAITEILAEIHRTIMKMMFESFGLISEAEKMIGASEHCFRFIKYRKAGMNESKMGIQPHTDKNWMAILHQNVSGLRVKLKDGEWCDVSTSPSSFLVLTGEAFMVWSNDWIPAGWHQVVLDEEKERYCIGLFTVIKGTIQIPKELVDDKHPLRYKSFDNIEYLRCNAVDDRVHIKSFCGL